MALPEVGVRAVVRDSKKFMSTLGKMSGAASGFGKTVLKAGAIAGGAALAGVGALGVGMAKLAMDAAPLEGIGNAFDGLTADMEGGSQKMLKALQVGSKGMVTNTQLMEGFNKAAMLVSKDFAQTLPDAMGYLGKVSAATGQDMDFMLDSLTTGIGRLSPMILDNLGIQVSLTEANEAYADSIGKSAKELTKSEQQTALMNQVMEKLAKNTEDMPDITDNASTKMAQFSVAMKNLKDNIGKALLPVFKKLVGFVSKVAGGFADLFEKFQGWGFEGFFSTFEDGSNIIGGFFADLGMNEELAYRIGDTINRIVMFVRNLIDGIGTLGQQFSDWGFDIFFSTFEDGSSAVSGFLRTLGMSEETAQKVGTAVNTLVQQIRDFIQGVIEATQPIRDWIKENVKLKDVLIAIGIILGTAILAAIASVVAALAPIILIIGGLILAVTLIRKAWETNWGGIRDKTKVVVDKLKEWFEVIRAWLEENIPKAMTTVKNFWENTLRPALEELWKFIQDPVIPIIIEIVKWLAEKIPEAFQEIQKFWNSTLKPALEGLWKILKNDVLPIVKTVYEWLKEKIPEAFEAIKQGWNNAKGVVQDIIDFFEDLWNRVNKVVQKVLDLIDAIKSIKMPKIDLPSIDLPWSSGSSIMGPGAGGTVGAAPVIGGTTSTSVSIPMNVTIANDMDLAVFEARVKQVVVDAIGA